MELLFTIFKTLNPKIISVFLILWWKYKEKRTLWKLSTLYTL